MGEGFRLVGFAITHRVPDPGCVGAGQPSVLEVPIEASLMDGRHGAKAHANGGEFPKLRHQPRMRVAGQTLSSHFLSEVLDLFVRQSPLKPSSSVDAGRCVALPVEVVAGRAVVLSSEEVIEADLPGMRNRSVG